MTRADFGAYAHLAFIAYVLTVLGWRFATAGRRAREKRETAKRDRAERSERLSRICGREVK